MVAGRDVRPDRIRRRLQRRHAVTGTGYLRAGLFAIVALGNRDDAGHAKTGAGDAQQLRLRRSAQGLADCAREHHAAFDRLLSSVRGARALAGKIIDTLKVWKVKQHQRREAHQRTIAVMGTGLDTIYPAQHKQLAEEIRQSGAIVTEFLPATLPLAAFFPRRNRIVSGLSLGVLVVEAALKSGSITTANAAANQGKMVFAIPGHIYSEHHQGCHQLIREGATLVDHPEQIIEDLALPTQWQAQQQRAEKTKETASPPASLPTHLIELYQILDWVGQDLDQLAQRYSASIAELTAQLMELELLGLCIQQGGRYLRCRPMH